MTRHPCAGTLLLVLFLLLSGCFSPSVQVAPGWTTETVSGTIAEAQGEPLVHASFVVVQEFHRSPIQFDGEPARFIPQARLVFPDADGFFQTGFDLRASQLQLTVIAPGYQMAHFSFNRQLGVGALRYDARLAAAERWRDHFLLQVVPFLDRFILDSRYAMPEAQQLFVGEWMDQQREDWAPDPNPTAAPPPEG